MGINTKTDNEYEICHVVDIIDSDDNSSKKRSMIFNKITVKNLEEAKTIVNDAIPKGKASFVKETCNKYSKKIYVEYIGDLQLTHIITIKKNGMLISEPIKHTKQSCDDEPNQKRRFNDNAEIKNKRNNTSKSSNTNDNRCSIKNKDKHKEISTNENKKKRTRRAGRNVKRKKREN